jgi:transcriptional regulator with XRE-family HTH domain
MNRTIQVFSQNVRHQREELGMTQEELAFKSHMAVRTMRAIESGKRRIRIDTLHKICKALKTTASELLSF